LLTSTDKWKRVGFYTTRFVEASSPQEAEKVAIDAIKHDPHLRGLMLNQQDDPLLVFVDEIEGSELA